MTKFARFPTAGSDQLVDDIYTKLNLLARFIDFGTGAPTHTPVGPTLYFNFAGGVNTSVYAWNGGWVALA